MIHWMPEAAEHVRNMQDIPKESLRTGADRIRAALDGMHPATARWDAWSKGLPISSIMYNHKYMEPEGTLSFLVAAMMCKKTGNRRLVGRFAHNEAVYASHLMYDDAQLTGAVFGEVAGIKPGRDGALYTIPVPDYIHLAVGLGVSWKLVNQDVYGGLVHLGKRDYVRLIRDSAAAYIRNRIMNIQNMPDTVQVPSDVQQWCEQQAPMIDVGDEPPCVAQARATMNRGENLSHSGRLLVATYAIHTGLDDDTINDMFTGAPDFNPRITKYQVRQIRAVQYKVPGCRWVERNHLCPGCNAIHPTKYRKPRG